MSGIERITGPLLDVIEQLFDAHQRGVELHGWPIVQSTKRAGPTVYRVLDRLEDAGWVTARWEEQDPELTRPRRRFYRLTPNGVAEVRSLLGERRPAALDPGAPPGRPAPGTAFWRRGLSGGAR
ncbi:helix-turn-helix transcriptional regulator [Spirillospora sp. NPDC047279]|uniref:PadR family transcriptional regulator n=1 Tax=Spirillospora sp. NPDC047279 TaxID=3155478 RepID=UPI0033D1413B